MSEKKKPKQNINMKNTVIQLTNMFGKKEKHEWHFLL